MAIPFPSTGFIAGFPYPTPAFQDPAGNYSSKAAWLATPAPTNAEWWDQISLRRRVASGIAVNTTAKTLTLTAAGGSKVFDLSGDGTGRIPVGIVDP